MLAATRPLLSLLFEVLTASSAAWEGMLRLGSEKKADQGKAVFWCPWNVRAEKYWLRAESGIGREVLGSSSVLGSLPIS